MSQDPTSFAIDFDPTSKRMRGRTRLGNKQFDVPIISQIQGNLWQGGCEDGLVLPDFFEHLISLYPWEEYTLSGPLKSSLTVKMYDSDDPSGIDTRQIMRLARWVADCVADGPTLVHCQAGLNRSSLVAAQSLIIDGWYSADEAIELLRTKRSDACLCNDAFEDWLHQHHAD